MWARYQERQPDLKIQIKILLKHLLVPIAAKLESAGTKLFQHSVP